MLNCYLTVITVTMAVLVICSSVQAAPLLGWLDLIKHAVEFPSSNIKSGVESAASKTKPGLETTRNDIKSTWNCM